MHQYFIFFSFFHSFFRYAVLCHSRAFREKSSESVFGWGTTGVENEVINWCIKDKNWVKNSRFSGLIFGDMLGFIPIVVTGWQYPWNCRGGGSVGRDRPSPGAPTLPRHGERVVWWLPVHLRGARQVSLGQGWSTRSRGLDVGMVPELPGPFLWRKLGSNGFVRVRLSATVRTASNPCRVAQPHNGAEGGVCSLHGQLATTCFLGASEVLAEAGGFLCLGWVTPAGGVILSCCCKSSYANSNPLRGMYPVVLGLHIPKFVRSIHHKI